MQADVKKKSRFVEAEDTLKQNEMPGAAHREEFGEPLDQA